ncbi:MAG: hypothetical protein ACI4RD_02240 [Kiritimatiellia bacterium]
MRRRWVWLVLAVAAAVVACLFLSGRLGRWADGGPSVSESEMPPAAEFEQVPPTGAEMNLEQIDASFGRGTNVLDRGKAETAP